MTNFELINVTKKFQDNVVVNNINLSIKSGELIALLGPSGCGKTTTLQMMAGFLELTSGDILLNGKSLKSVPPHLRNIGIVFQSYALFPHLNVFDNIAFGLRMRKYDVETIKKKVNEVLDIVQLNSKETRFPKELSGGQQQRVALVRALVIEPELLLLDEPLSNLDANLREQMRFEIRDIQKRVGITTIFVTHDQAEAMAVADRLVIMSNGHIRQIGTAREIYEKPDDLFVAKFIGQANIFDVTISAVHPLAVTMLLPSGYVAQAQSQHLFQSGTKTKFALRPESIDISINKVEGKNSLPGIIKRINYLGAFINISVEIGQLTLTVICTSKSQSLSVGNPHVFVNWDYSCGILVN